MNYLLPYIDVALMDTNTIETNTIFKSIGFTEKDSPKTVSNKLYSSKVVYIHPDGFDYWTDVLTILQEKKELDIKIFIFYGSDYFFDDEVMDYMTILFPKSKFFISNYVGTNTNCIMLPLITNIKYNKDIIKTCNFAIPHITLNCGYRHDFRKFIERNEHFRPYMLPSLPTNVYFDVLANLRFASAPRGNGHDTGRFWECLALGVIPLVENDIFYERLRETYQVTFIMLNKWDDLNDMVEMLDETLYKDMMDASDLSILSEEYWINKVIKK
jgi:hypothetical protein